MDEIRKVYDDLIRLWLREYRAQNDEVAYALLKASNLLIDHIK